MQSHRHNLLVENYFRYTERTAEWHVVDSDGIVSRNERERTPNYLIL